MASDDDMTGVTNKPTQPLFSDDDAGKVFNNICVPGPSRHCGYNDLI